MISRVNDVVGRLVALLILVSIGITAFEVVMRYLFNSPTMWVSETVQILFGFYFLLGGAYTLLHGGHVRVDILLHGFGKRGKRIIDIFGLVIALFFLTVMCWVSGESAIEATLQLERAESAWAPYVFPVFIAAPVAAILMIFQVLVQIFEGVPDTTEGAQ